MPGASKFPGKKKNQIKNQRKKKIGRKYPRELLYGTLSDGNETVCAKRVSLCFEMTNRDDQYSLRERYCSLYMSVLYVILDQTPLSRSEFISRSLGIHAEIGDCASGN